MRQLPSETITRMGWEMYFQLVYFMDSYKGEGLIVIPVALAVGLFCLTVMLFLTVLYYVCRFIEKLLDLRKFL